MGQYYYTSVVAVYTGFTIAQLRRRKRIRRRILLAKGAVEEPGDDRQVAALVVGREDNRVFIALGSHCIVFVICVSVLK